MSKEQAQAALEYVYGQIPIRNVTDKTASAYETIIAALEAMEGDGWRPIEKEPRRLKKGFMRIYTFKPFINKRSARLSLGRAYNFCRLMGCRECDGFIEIPAFPYPPKGTDDE